MPAVAAPSAYVRERPVPQGSRPPEPRERVRPSISSQILSSPAGVLLMLRFFLGVTFTFAGLQKLADPAYLDAKNPGSVQAQLLIYERMSPIHGIVHLAAQHAVLVGLLIAMGELAVGVGTLVGFWSRAAAVGGLLLSMAFWLTASWQSDPFYLSPDLVYLAAWTPIVFAGDGGLKREPRIHDHEIDIQPCFLEKASLFGEEGGKPREGLRWGGDQEFGRLREKRRRQQQETKRNRQKFLHSGFSDY